MAIRITVGLNFFSFDDFQEVRVLSLDLCFGEL